MIRGTTQGGTGMKKFKLYWRSGDTEIVEGTSIDDAFRRAGYSQGAIKGLDWFEEVKP